MEERRLPLSLGAWGSPVELDLSAEDMIGDIERMIYDLKFVQMVAILCLSTEVC
jgi:hypothetical protein